MPITVSYSNRVFVSRKLLEKQRRRTGPSHDAILRPDNSISIHSSAWELWRLDGVTGSRHEVTMAIAMRLLRSEVTAGDVKSPEFYRSNLYAGRNR